MGQAKSESPSKDSVGKIDELLSAAFASEVPELLAVTDINRGRGVFSNVYRLDVSWSRGEKGRQELESQTDLSPIKRESSDGPQIKPSSIVAKLPCHGPNRSAASSSGAYHRELAAYAELLVGSKVRRPAYYAGVDFGDETTGLLIEDLSDCRWVDQLNGLQPPDALAVADALAKFHSEWPPQRTKATAVRKSIVGTLSETALASGLDALESVWADDVEETIRSGFAALVNRRPQLVEMFVDPAQPVTLCHGDPRADNMVFDANDQPVLFDWQQTSMQFGEADLAWLAGTSLSIETRRAAEDELVSTYGGDFQRYRLGFALPGLAVLMLAQRQLRTEREIEFVVQSIRRIGQAVLDLEVPKMSL